MPELTWLERFAYVLALAFWRAYFDVQAARQEAEREVPDAKQLAVRDRFRALVGGLSQATRDPGSVSASPDRQGGGPDGVVRDSGSKGG